MFFPNMCFSWRPFWRSLEHVSVWGWLGPLPQGRPSTWTRPLPSW